VKGFVMTAGSTAYRRQILTQPEAVAKALSRTKPPLLSPDRPLVFTGVGSSRHACKVAANWVVALTGGTVRPVAVDSLELVLSGGVHAGEQLVVVSHRGTKRFTNDLLNLAKDAGANTVLVTGNGAANPAGDVVLRTCDDETASAHTVSYTTALAVLGRLVATLGGRAADDFNAALDTVPQAIADTIDLPAPTEAAARLQGIEPVLVAGSGVDAPTAEEAALKYKESTFLWAEAIGLELSLHGIPACFRSGMAGLLIRPDNDDRGRSRELAVFLKTLGAPVLEVAAGGGDVPFAPVPRLLRPLVSIVALQRLVAELADLQGGDPDHTRGETEPWASAIANVKLQTATSTGTTGSPVVPVLYVVRKPSCALNPSSGLCDGCYVVLPA
jgi:glutamine---fructose-6-phosphate transaminase (isomerizing)